MNPIAISTSITHLEKAGFIEKFALDGRSKGVRVLSKKDDFDKVHIDWEYLQKKSTYDFKRLDEMVNFAKAPGCTQNKILKYFGMKSEKKCGKCSSCTGKNSDDYTK